MKNEHKKDKRAARIAENKKSSHKVDFTSPDINADFTARPRGGQHFDKSGVDVKPDVR